MSKLLSTIFAASLVAGTGSTSLAETWNFASAYTPSEFQSRGYDMFAKLVEEKTNGELTITVHHAGSLFPNPEIVQATRDGLIEMGTQLMTNLGRDNALWEVDGVPFLVSGYDGAKKLWDATRPRLTELLAETGLTLVFAAPWPSQGFFFKNEVKSLDDVKGQSMRAYNPATTRLAELMGAEPTIVQMTEIPQAFATGLINSLNTSPTSGVVYKLWEHAGYYVKADAWLPKQMVFVRTDKFESLSQDKKQAVLDAATEVEAWLWDQSETLVTEAEATLEENGMKIIVPEGKLKEQLAEIGKTMAAEWMAKSDEEGKAIVESLQ